jgi:thiol:disulfide interchange protein DsbC
LRALAAKATLAAALTTCLSVTAWAQPSQPPTTPELTSLIGRLQALYPSTRFGEIRPTPWPGVFEVAMGANLAYVDASGQYFLFGHLYDMKAQRDLTAERKDTLARIDFSALPLADAIKDVRGRGSRALAIFSDPDCPHCRRLEAELEGPVRRDDPHLPDADRLAAPAGAGRRPSPSGARRIASAPGRRTM